MKGVGKNYKRLSKKIPGKKSFSTKIKKRKNKMPKPKVLISKVPVSKVPVSVSVPPVSVSVPPVPVSVPVVPVPPVSVVPPVPPVPSVPTMEFYRPAKTTAKGTYPEIRVVYTVSEIAGYMGIPVSMFATMPINVRVKNMIDYHTSLQHHQSPGGRHPLFGVLKKYIPIGTAVTPVSFAAALKKVREEIISLEKDENLRKELIEGIAESRESDRKSNKKTKKTNE